MRQHDEEEEDEDELLDLADTLLATCRALVDEIIDGKQSLVEMGESDQLEVLAGDRLVREDERDAAHQADQVGDQERALQVGARRLLKIVNVQGQINSVQVDEEGEAPQSIDRQVEGVPVNIVTIVVEVLLEADRKRRPDDVEKNDQGEDTIPYLHIERVHVKFVPGHVRLLSWFHITVGVFALGVAVIRVGGDRLVEHLLQLALLHVVPHVVQAAAQEHEQADLAPELPDSLLALVCVHGTKWLVKFLPTSDGLLHTRLVKHALNLFILVLFVFLCRPVCHQAWLIDELVEGLLMRISALAIVFDFA